MSRRNAIQMNDEEVRAFLAERRTAQVATLKRDGSIHLVTMWYGVIDDEVVMWTYAKSQKARNLRRCATVAVLVESGERYDELRGVSISGTAEISDDRERVERVGRAVMLAPGAAPADDQIREEILEKTAAKRVAITVKATKVASWDHRKLGGGY